MATAEQENPSFLERVKRPFMGISDFLNEVYQEMQRVSWPTHEETYSFTVIVIIAIVIVSIWVSVWDWIFTQLLGFLNI